MERRRILFTKRGEIMNQKFYFHDVLQCFKLGKAQRREIAEHSHYDLLTMGMKPFEEAKDITVILLIVAEGIEYYPMGVEYIKKHPEWIIACHGLHHDRYNYKTYEEAYRDLAEAKTILEKAFERKVTIFLPPKLRYNKATEKACADLGLEIHTPGHFAIKYMEASKVDNYPRLDVHAYTSEDRRMIDFFFEIKRLKKLVGQVQS